MKRESFNAGWEVVTTQKDFPFGTVRKPVMLPYDALLDETRTPDAAGGAGTGFYPAHVSTYEKKFIVPAEWADQHIVFEFEGVYSHSSVFINREYAGGCSHGYTNFLIIADGFLKYGEENEIKVTARCGADSRWYNGCGIYRDVSLLRGEDSYILPYGQRIVTNEADDDGALLEVSVSLGTVCRLPRTLSVTTQVIDADGTTVSEGTEPVTAFSGEIQTLVQHLYVTRPVRWSVDHPYLYTVRTMVAEQPADGGVQRGNGNGAHPAGTGAADAQTVGDIVETSFGIRTLSLDAAHGLRIKGETVKLRRACVHMSVSSSMTSMPSRSQAQRNEREIWLCALRTALKPAFFSSCTRRSSAL